MSEHTVAAIVRDALGEKPDWVSHVPTLEASHVYRLHLRSGDAFFKSEHEGHPIDVAAWAYTKAATVGVPVPEVLHLDLSCERWPEEFMITTAVEGTDLQHDPLDGRALASVLEGYGELLRSLHSVELEGFGDLEFQEAKVGDPVGPFTDNASHIRRSLDWSLPYVVEHDFVAPEHVRRIETILDRNEELVVGPDTGVLLHNDPGLDHLFVERTSMRITGLIDFEPRSGDPAWDLSVFAYHYPELAHHLMGGYGSLPGDLDVRLRLYGLLRAVGCASWEHERGMDIAYPLAQIARRLKELEALL
jgi:aminoglycoside phosphotransferase (APT) family kinase protein